MSSNQSKGAGAARLDRIVAEAQRSKVERERGYREQALKLYPWICGRCQREFTRTNVQELTVHHRNHDHDDNPSDGSNWELLCIYCHDNEHQRLIEAKATAGAREGDAGSGGTHNPFAALGALLKNDK